MQNRRPSRPRLSRQLPWWQVALIDIGLIGVSLLVFALFDHVIPHRQQAVPAAQPVVQATATPAPEATPVWALPLYTRPAFAFGAAISATSMELTSCT